MARWPSSHTGPSSLTPAASRHYATRRHSAVPVAHRPLSAFERLPRELRNAIYAHSVQEFDIMKEQTKIDKLELQALKLRTVAPSLHAVSTWMHDEVKEETPRSRTIVAKFETHCGYVAMGLEDDMAIKTMRAYSNLPIKVVKKVEHLRLLIKIGSLQSVSPNMFQQVGRLIKQFPSLRTLIVGVGVPCPRCDSERYGETNRIEAKELFTDFPSLNRNVKATIGFCVDSCVRCRATYDASLRNARRAEYVVRANCDSQRNPRAYAIQLAHLRSAGGNPRRIIREHHELVQDLKRKRALRMSTGLRESVIPGGSELYL